MSGYEHGYKDGLAGNCDFPNYHPDGPDNQNYREEYLRGFKAGKVAFDNKLLNELKRIPYDNEPWPW